MLGTKTYEKKYMDACQANITGQLKAYNELLAQTNGNAVENFELLFFNNLVVVLDAFFVHRLRGLEGKYGNPLNEVRVLANSILYNKSIMNEDNTIKMKPENSVRKLKLGHTIKFTQPQFTLLAKMFFEEIQKKYSQPKVYL